VVLDHAHDVEAVGYDAGLGKITPDEAAVGLERSMQTTFSRSRPLSFIVDTHGIRLTSAWFDIEDPSILKVSEGGAEALALVQGVPVDAEVARTVQREAFGWRKGWTGGFEGDRNPSGLYSG
jgi:hypothetical protein